MKVIPILATKGGTGKTKVCVELGRALSRRGFKVGFLDVDWVAPNLHLELGVDKDPHLVLESGVGDVIKPIISPEGFPLISSSFIFPSDQAVFMDEESEIKDILEITTPGVVNWGPLDYLMMDTPPTTTRMIHTALKISGLHGVILVTQPATPSIADLMRTVSLVKELKVPVAGLIGNQVYISCSHGERVNLFDLDEEDIKVFCKSQGIPYLGSLPHVPPSRGSISLNGVVDTLLSTEPVLLKMTPVSSLPYKLVLAIARKVRKARSG